MTDADKDAAMSLLASIVWGEALDAMGTPFYCQRMMQECSTRHKRDGACRCDNYDAKLGASVLAKLFTTASNDPLPPKEGKR